MNSLELSREQFLSLTEQISQIAADYLDGLNGRKIPAGAGGEEIERIFRVPVPEQGIGEEALAGLRDVARYSRAQNARFFGYVLGSGETSAAATDVLCSVLNQNATAWRSAPAAITIEKTVVGWLAEAIGCPDFFGSLTGGGSSANLMGLAIARESKAPSNEFGVASGARLAVYASSEVHMSIPKAVALLGIGRENLRSIPVDESFRMVPAELERAIVKDKENGVVPLAIVASAGTVKTGAIDPLAAIAGIARKNGAWFHIDGAYGALAAIAEPEKFAGINEADSVSLDPHKWLYQPLDCGCLLYRNPQAARKAFSHSGDYVRVLNTDPIEGFAFFEESIELSRRFRALKLWFSLRYHGMQAFRQSIQKDLAQGQNLGALISQNAQLQLMAPVSLSAACFRYAGTRKMSESELDDLNTRILRRIIERGTVYLSNATIGSAFCLRACIVNHRTTDADVQAVIDETLAAAREVQAK